MADEYGDDDFEDYDDEFEDDDVASEAASPERGTLHQALREQARAAESIQHARAAAEPTVAAPFQAQYQRPAEPVVVGLTPPRRAFIAPPSGEDRATKDLKRERLRALRSVLTLTEAESVLYDAAPLTPYELHTRYQSHNLRAKGVQTGDDDVDQCIQTDEIDAEAVACQWPEDGAAAGAYTGLDGLESSSSAKTTSLLSANVGSLKRFLASAGRVMETLCSENLMAAAGATDGFVSANSMPFSIRHCALSLPAALGERPPHDLAFSPDGNALLAAFGKPSAVPEFTGRSKDGKALKRFATGGMLAFWRLHTTAAPWSVLRCIGTPTCCILPAARPHLAFAGTEEGSVQLWNLREPGVTHPSVDIGGADRLALRSPTYCSDCLGAGGAHATPIVSLSALPAAEGSGLSIASLDLEGTLLLWLVLEEAELDALDLGQAFGGKERLLRSGSVDLVADAAGGASADASENASANGNPRRRSGGATALKLLPTRCAQAAFLPKDPSRLLVATDLPRVLHRSRYDPTPPAPDTFGAPGGRASSGVTSLAFCPTAPSHFLAGRANGAIELYCVDDREPLLSWDSASGGAIVQLAWSPSRPTLFWALDATDAMHIFDLASSSPGRPALSTPLASSHNGVPSSASLPSIDDDDADDAAPRTLRFALDARIETGAVAAQRQRMLAVTTRVGGRLSGIEVHVVAEKFANALPEEQETLHRVLRRL